MDVGAGSGLFSLAAAARGHHVLSFELSPKSLSSLRASVEYNGFEKLLSLHEVRPPLHAGPPGVPVLPCSSRCSRCPEPSSPRAGSVLCERACGACHTPQQVLFSAPGELTPRAGVQLALGAHEETICVGTSAEGQQPRHLAHGYAAPWQHSAHAHCNATAKRARGGALLPPGLAVGSLRISAPGWEGWVLDGLQVLQPGFRV